MWTWKHTQTHTGKVKTLPNHEDFCTHNKTSCTLDLLLTVTVFEPLVHNIIVGVKNFDNVLTEDNNLFISRVLHSGGATPGRARSNDLAEELPPLLVPRLTKISIDFINIVHKQINFCYKM